MQNITITQLKQHLKSLSQENMMAEIQELFQKFPAVKEFYQVKLNFNGEDDSHKKYKEIIKNEFFPVNGFGKLRLSVARGAISDFKKLSKNQRLIADLMIFYVEQGVEFTNSYGDICEAFYNSMESMAHSAAEFVVKNKFSDAYKERFKKIAQSTSGIGWGFHDTLEEIYYDNFGE
ncbi:MAG: DUF6155 family protein [bacterium]